MKKESGITLIALVITIIVLLILAGVSISLTLGNNGVLTQSTNAVKETKKASAKEDVEMAWAGATTKYWNDWVSDTTKVKKLEFYKEELEGKNTSAGIITTILEGEEEGTYEINYTYTASNPNELYRFVMNADGQASLVVMGNASDIAADYANNIGAYVNYIPKNTSTYSGEWQILFANNKNVYIIAKDRILGYTGNLAEPADSDKYGGTGDFADLTRFPAVKDGWLYKIYNNETGEILYDSGTNPNMKAAEYMLDSSETTWSSLENDFAKWVIGSPTLELLVASYNAVNPSDARNIGNLSGSGYGSLCFSQWGSNAYALTQSDSRPWNHGSFYYLACPTQSGGNTHIAFVRNSYVEDCYLYNVDLGFRPVVCLKSSTILTKNASGSYDLTFAE